MGGAWVDYLCTTSLNPKCKTTQVAFKKEGFDFGGFDFGV